jgi:acetyl esterase
MRVDLSPAARVVALAALLVSGLVVTGCAAQVTPTTPHNVHHLAALLGTAGRGSLDRGHLVAALAELSGPADLTENGAGAPLIEDQVLSYRGCPTFVSCSQAVQASPADNVDSSDAPFFIGHSQDELIPMSQTVNFVARLKAAHVRVTLVTTPGTLHSTAMLTPTLRTQIVEFFRSTVVHDAPTTANS